MKSTNFSRREWLKKGTLAFGAMALVPHDIWSSNVIAAQKEGRTFLYNSNNYFNEFTPPIIKEENSLTILRKTMKHQACFDINHVLTPPESHESYYQPV